jgi:hypothetical protein
VLIEFGNHNRILNAIDDRPKVTTIHIPEADETGLGGYTHKPGKIKPLELRDHLKDALTDGDGITHLPDHEILLSVVQAWPHHVHRGRPPFMVAGKPAEGRPDFRPAWVRVRSHEQVHGPIAHPGPNDDGSIPIKIAPHSPKVAEDIENFLREYYELPDDAVKPDDLEDRYWTKWGAPGEYPRLPDVTALFTDDGRTQQAINYGGGQVGATGAATGSSATTLTNSGASWTSNQWAGYRVYAQSSTSNMVWGNIVSNTSTALTVDRWYAAATPGGSAGSTPSSTSPYMIADGGMVAAWFVGMTTTNITPVHGDHSMSGEYTTSGGGFLRKIAPYALTSGTSPMSYTLTPVFTGNGSDTYPSTFYAIGCFTSMVTSFAQAGGPMKFETSLNASATVAASGDQVTVTETGSGS